MHEDETKVGRRMRCLDNTRTVPEHIVDNCRISLFRVV